MHGARNFYEMILASVYTNIITLGRPTKWAVNVVECVSKSVFECISPFILFVFDLVKANQWLILFVLLTYSCGTPAVNVNKKDTTAMQRIRDEDDNSMGAAASGINSLADGVTTMKLLTVRVWWRLEWICQRMALLTWGRWHHLCGRWQRLAWIHHQTALPTMRPLNHGCSGAWHGLTSRWRSFFEAADS